MMRGLGRCLLCCALISHPQQLRCNHVFCRKCWIQFRTLSFKATTPEDNQDDLTDLLCPICAQVITADEVSLSADDEGFAQFSTSVELRLKEELQDSSNFTCEVCAALIRDPEEPKYCADCAKGLCFDCGCWHLKQEHAVWQMPEGFQVFCRHHGQRISSVCSACKEAPLCLDCQHNSKGLVKHRTQPWQEYINSKKEKLEHCMPDLKEEMQEVARSFQQLQQLRQIQQKQLRLTCAQIDMQAELMVREIDEQKQRLKETLLHRLEQVDEAISNQEELLRFHNKSMQHLIGLIRLLGRGGQEAALLSNYDGIRLRSFNLCQRKIATPSSTGSLTKGLFFTAQKSLALGSLDLDLIPEAEKVFLRTEFADGIENDEEEEEEVEEGAQLVWRVGLDPGGLSPTAQPHGLHFKRDGHLVVALYGGRCIREYDLSGRLQTAFSAAKEDIWPRDICMLDKSTLLVADSHTRRIRAFRTDSYTSKKDHGVVHAPHLFKEPTSVTVSRRLKRIIVSDTSNSDITIMGVGGDVQRRFGSHGQEFDQFDHPEFVCIDQNNERINVSDCNNHCIKVFDLDGGFITSIGSHGQDQGQLSHPGGIAVDEYGNIVVADGANNRVCIFSSDGAVCRTLLSHAQHGIAWPYGLSIHRRGLRTRVAVTQRVDSSVYVFEYDQTTIYKQETEAVSNVVRVAEVGNGNQ